jgi:hypothetical protein
MPVEEVKNNQSLNEARMKRYWERTIFPWISKDLGPNAIGDIMTYRFYLNSGMAREAFTEFQRNFQQKHFRTFDEDWTSKEIEEFYVDQWILINIFE